MSMSTIYYRTFHQGSKQFYLLSSVAPTQLTFTGFEPDDRTGSFPFSFLASMRKQFDAEGLTEVALVQVPVCSHCGSREIWKDATASWSIAKQDWVLCDTQEDYTCEECGGETSIKMERTLTPAETLKDRGPL